MNESKAVSRWLWWATKRSILLLLLFLAPAIGLLIEGLLMGAEQSTGQSNPESKQSPSAKEVFEKANGLGGGKSSGLEAAWLASSNACVNPKDFQARYLRAYLLKLIKSSGKASKKVNADTYTFKELAEELRQNKAADLNPDMLYQISLFLAEQKDPAEAEICELAAQAGHPRAQWRLAQCFLEGRLKPKDEAKGREWALKAATAGVPEAVEYFGKQK